METYTIPTESQVAEISVSYSANIPVANRLTISSPRIAAEILRLTWNPNIIEFHEAFKIMLLNRRMHLLGIVTLAEGSGHQTPVDLRHLMAIVLKTNASAIILAHNHPSGDSEPSVADKQMTELVVLASELFSIKVCDHIILTAESYFSFSDNNIIEYGEDFQSASNHFQYLKKHAK